MKFESQVEFSKKNYDFQDDKTWKTMMQGQISRNKKFACSEYIKGFNCFNFPSNSVADLDLMSEMLFDLCGWRLVPVNCLVPSIEFFEMLKNRFFPISVAMRKKHEIGFAELPDYFHDLVGHLPLLLTESVQFFLYEFSNFATNYSSGSDLMQRRLANLFWYTLETGYLIENGELKVYGGAILTSDSECENLFSKPQNRKLFDLHEIVDLEFDNLELQDRYFELGKISDLFTLMSSFKENFATNKFNLGPVVNNEKEIT